MAYKLIYDKNSCIGAGECEAIAKNFWKVNNEGFAELKGSTLNKKTGMYELEISDDDVETQKIVVGSCPISCIRLEKI